MTAPVQRVPFVASPQEAKLPEGSPEQGDFSRWLPSSKHPESEGIRARGDAQDPASGPLARPSHNGERLLVADVTHPTDMETDADHADAFQATGPLGHARTVDLTDAAARIDVPDAEPVEMRPAADAVVETSQIETRLRRAIRTLLPSGRGVASPRAAVASARPLTSTPAHIQSQPSVQTPRDALLPDAVELAEEVTGADADIIRHRQASGSGIEVSLVQDESGLKVVVQLPQENDREALQQLKARLEEVLAEAGLSQADIEIEFRTYVPFNSNFSQPSEVA